jgi:signal transduction histidine kinase/CheY-like chemotaxis protein
MVQTDSDVTEDIIDPQQALVELAQCTLASSAEDALWDDAVQILGDSMQVECVAALRCSNDNVGFDLIAGAGIDKSLVGTRMAERGEGTSLDTVIAQSEPVVVDDVGTESRFLPSPIANLNECKSGMSIAIRYDDRVWGVCEFYWRDPFSVCEGHVGFGKKVVVLLGAGLRRIEREQRSAFEQRRLRDQLRQSQKLEALGLLSGGVAHDFNNHLTVIKGYSELLLASMPQADPRRSQVEKIHQVSEKAHLLADQLLAFSRRKVREPCVIDLNAAIRGLYDILRSLIGENIDLECVTTDEDSFVEIDPSDIEQAILNLAVNARDAIEGKGSITIRTRAALPAELDSLERSDDLGPDPLVLAVRDTGEGMSSEVIEQVFDPFFTTKDVRKGTGLGLATVLRIVADAGGDIAVTSQQGGGTCFKLFFPRAQTPVEDSRDHTLEEFDLEGDEVIMVVEDDPDVLEFIIEVLHRYGYDSIPSTDGREAIELLEIYHDSIDAVICDVVLPHVSTDELRSELVDRYEGIPFLMTSGYADLEQFRDDDKLCDLAFVAKPMSPSALLTELRSLLDNAPPTENQPTDN